MKYLGLLLLLLTGCATIISGTTDKVMVNSRPGGVPFTIQDERGMVVTHGVTPQKVSLKRGSGWFEGQTYRVNYDLKGYYSQNSLIDYSINPWYFGNLILGGIIIGGVIVDPLTGAMWDLQKETDTVLFPIQ